MLSELATNVVQHASTEFEVEISVTPDAGGRSVRVRVSDEAPGFPTPQEPGMDAPHGRGLRIVESLADAWVIEVRRDRPGKTVWFDSLLGATEGGADGAERRSAGGRAERGSAGGSGDGRGERRGGRRHPGPGPCPACAPCSTAWPTGSSPATTRE